MKTARTLVNEFKRMMYSGDGETRPKAREMADDYGVRIRQTAHSKQFGALDTFEVGTTYFYSVQATNGGVVKRLGEFAEGHGWQVEVLNYWRGEVVEGVSREHMLFGRRPWPKTSWATCLVRITKIEAD